MRPKPPSSKQQNQSPQPPRPDALTDFYRGLDRDALTRQGADHLRNRADVRAYRFLHLVRVMAWTVIIAALVLGAGFSGWLLLTAKRSGQTFSEVREQVIRAYDEPDE